MGARIGASAARTLRLPRRGIVKRAHQAREIGLTQPRRRSDGAVLDGGHKTALLIEEQDRSQPPRRVEQIAEASVPLLAAGARLRVADPVPLRADPVRERTSRVRVLRGVEEGPDGVPHSFLAQERLALPNVHPSSRGLDFRTSLGKELVTSSLVTCQLGVGFSSILGEA